MDSEHVYFSNDAYVMKTYAAKRLLVSGSGSHVTDADGNEFLDFTSGIAVCNVGHCHPAVTAAIQEQAQKLVHVSNLFLNEKQPHLAELLVRNGFDGRVFFANSGAEANEGLIKFARQWGSSRGRDQIVAMNNSFHGRTLATLAATDRPAMRKGFQPDMTGFSFAEFNNLESVEAAITDKTAAILVEPIQGEGGVCPADPQWLSAVRELCDTHGILLMFDEVQTGIGRTGNLYCWQGYGIEPDAFSLAKGLGNGFPIGAFVVQRRWEDVLQPGHHASTFGGTPLACAAASAVIETIINDNLLAACREASSYFMGGLRSLAQKHEGIIEVRGEGLLIGVALEGPAGPLVQAAAEQGLLILSAGADVLRLLPPLTVSRDELDDALAILDTIFGDREA